MKCEYHLGNNLELFAVRLPDGRWFRSGGQWVTDIKRARVYSKPNPARAVITQYSNRPDNQIPQLVVLHVTGYDIVDEKGRVAEVKKRKMVEAVALEERHALVLLQLAQERLATAQNKRRRLDNAT